MKCLSIVTLFGLIAIAAAGTQRLDEVNHHMLQHRIARQAQFSSSSTSSSSSSASGEPGQPVVFHQTSSSFNSFLPAGGNVPNAATNTNTGTNQVPNLLDRFGPDDSTDNASAAGPSQSNNAQAGNEQPTGNAQGGGVPFGTQFPGATFGNGQFPGQFPGAAPFGNVPNYGNVPVFTGGHFSSVAGQYDPNTQQTVIYHNYNQQLK